MKLLALLFIALPLVYGASVQRRFVVSNPDFWIALGEILSGCCFNVAPSNGQQQVYTDLKVPSRLQAEELLIKRCEERCPQILDSKGLQVANATCVRLCNQCIKRTDVQYMLDCCYKTESVYTEENYFSRQSKEYRKLCSDTETTFRKEPCPLLEKQRYSEWYDRTEASEANKKSGNLHVERRAGYLLHREDKKLTMGKYQLYYFPLRGRGQATRYLMIDNEIEYEEINTRNNWVTDFKPKMPFGQAPMLKDGDFDIAQSNTIIRYLGRKHGLYPDDVKEAAKVDMITDYVEDIRGPYVRMIYQNYEDGKDEFVKSLDGKFQYIENLFKAWKTDFISSKISFADYNLFDMLDDLVILSSTCLDKFPTLKAYYDRMASRPALKKYRDTDAFKSMNVNGNGKQ